MCEKTKQNKQKKLLLYRNVFFLPVFLHDKMGNFINVPSFLQAAYGGTLLKASNKSSPSKTLCRLMSYIRIYVTKMVGAERGVSAVCDRTLFVLGFTEIVTCDSNIGSDKLS